MNMNWLYVGFRALALSQSRAPRVYWVYRLGFGLRGYSLYGLQFKV